MQEVQSQDLELNSSMFKRIKPYILPVLIVLGILLSIELIIIYFKANFIAGAKPSFCTLNETIDCDAVARTAFSHFLGLPLALWGLGMYTFILFLNFLPSIKLNIFESLKNSNSYIFTISSFAVIMSFVLAGISSLEIHKVCILCVITYVINILIFAASKNGESALEHYKNSFNDLISFLKEPASSLLILIIAAIASVSLYLFNTTGIFVPKNPFDEIKQDANRYESSGNILGAKNPTLIINEYTDFQCPYCSISHSMMERLVQEVPGVQVVHHDFPLNNKCNPIIKKAIHQDSCTAALYSRAAKLQGKYWELNSKMFDNQENLSETNILKLAEGIGLNTAKLKVDANNPAMKEQLLIDAKAADNLGITATPTMYIGMKKYEGIMPYPDLKNIVLSNLR